MTIVPGLGTLMSFRGRSSGGGGGEEPAALSHVSSTVTSSESAAYAPSGVLEGDAIVLIRFGFGTAVSADPTILDPPGFTLENSEDTGGHFGRLLWKEAAADGETIDLSIAGLGSAITWVYVLRNARVGSPVGDSDTNFNTSSRTANFRALTMTNSRSYVIGAVHSVQPTIAPQAVSGTPAVTNVASGISVTVGYRGFYLGPAASFSSRTSVVEVSSEPAIRWLTMDAEIVSAA